jgi:hypothetical protein
VSVHFILNALILIYVLLPGTKRLDAPRFSSETEKSKIRKEIYYVLLHYRVVFVRPASGDGDWYLVDQVLHGGV